MIFFVGGRPGFVAAGGEDFVEEGEGGVGLLDGYQLLRTTQSSLGLVQKR